MMTISIAILALFLPLTLMATDAAKNANPPDAIFVNGDIYTQATPARAQAMAVRDGRIVAIGTNDDIRKLKGSQTQVVDLGRTFRHAGIQRRALSSGIGRIRADERRIWSAPSRLQRCSSALRSARKPGLRATGSSASGWDHTLWPGQKSADAAGHGRGDERPSGDLRPRRWAHRCRELSRVAGGGHHGTDEGPRRAATSITTRRASRRESFASRRKGLVFSKVPAADAGAAPPCGRVGAGRRRALGHHVGAGQLRLGTVSGLRRDGA